jgi:type II secretory pathway component GspD/PulD (secretin)
MGAGQNAANLFSPAAIAGKGLAGALTHVHSAYALAVSLTALREKGKARSVSRTSLLTVNNLAAEMSDTQSYHAKVVGT